MKLLVTGGAGFIGSHFVRHILKTYPDYSVINLDKLTYAGDLNKLSDVANHPRYRFVQGDIVDRSRVDSLASEVNAIVHFAAETHVDRSIADASPFLQTNVIGTQVLIEASLKHKHQRYVQVSTDEVYGDIEVGAFTETSPLKPSSPYSASKAAGDMLVMAAVRTYGLPGLISRCSNNYGPHQYPEKLIPFFVQKLLKGETVPIYGDGSNVRDWLHVEDHCRAVDLMLHRGKIGEVYNVGAHNEHTNLEITQRLLRLLNLPEDRITFVKDRPGHDVRYAIDSSKLQNELGWKPTVDFEAGFAETISFYQTNLVKN
ncbi:dTDP-glucose 4,6-dehydratase [Candidatus Peregrinibacteria bacterium]|nr:MAG: dTDP-glucose 4,6-dehydratase [Candidatus Peregrinibacteria bacterium]